MQRRSRREMPATEGSADDSQPALRAIDILETSLRQAERENTLRDLVAIDLRSLAWLRQRFTEKPQDPDNRKFLRQLVVVWSTRLSGTDHRTFRELFSLVEKCERS
jgi:hypothetical protein